MSISIRTFLSYSAIAGTLALSALPAQAEISADAVFNAFANVAGKQGGQVAAENRQMSGDGVVLEGVTITSDLPNGQKLTVPLGQIEFQGISETPNGSYVVEQTAMEGFQFKNDQMAMTVQGLVLANFYLPSDAETNPILKGGYYSAAKSGPASLAIGGNTVATATGMEVAVSPYAENSTMESKGTLSGININIDAIRDPKVKETISALGYETLTGSISFDTAWNIPEGEIVVNDMTFAGNDAANVTLKADLKGYTPEIVEAMQQVQKQGNDQQKSLAMMGLYQQLQVGSFSLTIKDQSLTGRVLDFVAQQQGTNRESVIAMAKGMVPFGLAQLGAPDFAAMTTAAVGQYLDNPDTITVSANPPAPVPISQLIAGAAGGPASVIQALNVKVTANE